MLNDVTKRSSGGISILSRITREAIEVISNIIKY